MLGYVKENFLKLLFIVSWALLLGLYLTNKEFGYLLHEYCLKNPFYAPIILIICQLIMSAFCLPCSFLTLIAGSLWGIKLGILYSMVSTLVASSSTFILGRFFLKSPFKNHTSLLSKIVELVNRYRWKASFIGHINPILPGSSLGYVFGLSRVPFVYFFLGAALGTLPLQFLLLTLGKLTF